MTRPVPEGRTVSMFEWECAAAPMTGYLQSAAEDVADHGNTITDTHPHVLAAAHMNGCALIHAAHVAAEPQHAIARELARIADAMERQTMARERQATNLFELANAVNELADDLPGALAVHSDEVASGLESVAASVDALRSARADTNYPQPGDEA